MDIICTSLRERIDIQPNPGGPGRPVTDSGFRSTKMDVTGDNEVLSRMDFNKVIQNSSFPPNMDTNVIIFSPKHHYARTFIMNATYPHIPIKASSV